MKFLSLTKVAPLCSRNTYRKPQLMKMQRLFVDCPPHNGCIYNITPASRVQETWKRVGRKIVRARELGNLLWGFVSQHWQGSFTYNTSTIRLPKYPKAESPRSGSPMGLSFSTDGTCVRWTCSHHGSKTMIHRQMCALQKATIMRTNQQPIRTKLILCKVCAQSNWAPHIKEGFTIS